MRRFFILSSWTSAILGVLMVVLWMRSYTTGYDVRTGTIGRVLVTSGIGQGVVDVRCFRHWPTAEHAHSSSVRYTTDFAELSHRKGSIVAYHIAGANARDWKGWIFQGRIGYACVVVDGQGNPRWDVPVVAGLQLFATNRYSQPMPFWEITTPCWPIVALLGVLPAAALGLIASKAIARARRRRQGRCPHCGYDLRGSDRLCPECGADVPPNSKVSRA
jgi:hypothetical protein